MPWSFRLDGVFSLSLEGDNIQVILEKSSGFAQYEALQLANALTQASHEIAYRKAFGHEREKQTEIRSGALSSAVRATGS
jgi:hypothetical protein